MSESREVKRRKLEESPPSDLVSLNRNVSPPPGRTKPTSKFDPNSRQILGRSDSSKSADKSDNGSSTPQAVTPSRPSPFRLTKIYDLDDQSNVDTITLNDILGRPDLKEVWLFDFLYDVDFVMSAFHPSIRRTILVKIIHGSSRRDSAQNQHLRQAEKEWLNLQVICAYMPEQYGTHHSKMMILFTSDDEAQVVIHTANMIPFDWGNMTQGVWLSPILRKLDLDSPPTQSSSPIGTGARFKVDLMRYLEFYESRTSSLVEQLKKYDFSSIRAAFIASVPGRVHMRSASPNDYTSFGWPGLREVLRAIPQPSKPTTGKDNIVAQISSIASLGEKWETNFFDLLCTSSRAELGRKPSVQVVYPTTDEIRNSLNGYRSGTSIHMKSDSTRGKNQFARLRSKFCNWAPREGHTIYDAFRGQAAPHIKTFIRFTNDFQAISWALLTSANLSTQAWGSLPDQDGDVRISSYEVGVLIWPDLLKEDDGAVTLVPAFGKDQVEVAGDSNTICVPFRMPYGLPLIPYGSSQPWTTDANHTKHDRFGKGWAL
jgi:tyrosyl-DNA phosphodiesterase 1